MILTAAFVEWATVGGELRCVLRWWLLGSNRGSPPSSRAPRKDRLVHVVKGRISSQIHIRLDVIGAFNFNVGKRWPLPSKARGSRENRNRSYHARENDARIWDCHDAYADTMMTIITAATSSQQKDDRLYQKASAWGVLEYYGAKW